MSQMSIPVFRSWLREHGWPNETATAATAIAYAQSRLVNDHESAGLYGWWGLTRHQVERFDEQWRLALADAEQVNLGLYYSAGGLDWVNFPAAYGSNTSTTARHLYKLGRNSPAAKALPTVKRALSAKTGPQSGASAPSDVHDAWGRVQDFTGKWGRNEYGRLGWVRVNIRRIHR